MNIQRNVARRGQASKSSRPRMSAAKKEEIAELMSRLRFLIGSELDKTAHTVQIVYTSDTHESSILLQSGGTKHV